MNLIYEFWKELKRLNHRRIENHRLCRVLADDLPERRNKVKPSVCGGRSILLIDSMYGLGDALFVNGLIQKLTSVGERVILITLRRTFCVYESNSNIEKIYLLENIEDLERLKKEKIDIAVDLGYVGLDRWDLRKPILKEIDAYVLTCCHLARCANMVNGFVDVSKEHHISGRMRLILEALDIDTSAIPEIRPFYEINKTQLVLPTKKKSTSIYVNCVAGEDDRCFSKEQIEALAQWFETQERFEGIFFLGKNVQWAERRNIKINQPGTFKEFAHTISLCCAVISPDTMPVHMASALDIPCLAFFCGGEKDYFKNCAMVETWCPMSVGSKCVLSASPFEMKQRRLTPISKIDPQDLINEVETFLTQV